MVEQKLSVVDENPFKVREDTSVLLPAASSRMPTTPPLSCTILGSPDNSRTLFFTQSSLRRFHRPSAWLDDDCINFGSQVILRHFGADGAGGDPALFPSFTFSMHRGGESDDRAVWRVSRHALDFWNKDIWLFPIHRANHWTLAIVYWRKHMIAYFDSLGSKSAHKFDSPIIFTLLQRLLRIAGEYGHVARNLEGEWVAFPLVTEPLQHNSYDCGVWVLACTAAVLRGFTSVNISAASIAEFRLKMLALIYAASEIDV